ncbi:hypothetical protein FQN54_002358 [Arachnomyces sp. PD_36]|nr:hypothetical protein FQN54_002358 [Arachnomyces sp. PD_36]
MFKNLLTAAVFATAAIAAPTARSTCDRWNIQIWQDDVCGAQGGLANNIYIGAETKSCTSTSGFSVPLNSMSLQGDSHWVVTAYDNDDCTCSNLFTCPNQFLIERDGSTTCHDWSGYSSFEVEVGVLGACG